METWSEFLLALAVNTKYFLENNFSNIKCKVDKRYLNIKNKFIRIIQRSTSIHIRHYKHSSTPDFASSNTPNLSFFPLQWKHDNPSSKIKFWNHSSQEISLIRSGKSCTLLFLFHQKVWSSFILENSEE
jgi:hypothetical protein